MPTTRLTGRWAARKQPLVHAETLSTALGSEMSSDYSVQSSDGEDTVERAYWERLVQKAVNNDDADSEEISLTQDETDLSSFLDDSNSKESGSVNIEKLISQARDKLGMQGETKKRATFSSSTKKPTTLARPFVQRAAVEDRDPIKIKEVKQPYKTRKSKG